MDSKRWLQAHDKQAAVGRHTVHCVTHRGSQGIGDVASPASRSCPTASGLTLGLLPAASSLSLSSATTRRIADVERQGSFDSDIENSYVRYRYTNSHLKVG